MQESWFVRQSFMFVTYIIPLGIIYGVFFAIVPQESLNQKPPLPQAVGGLALALMAWFILVPVFSIFWAVLMRIIYGKSAILTYLEQSSQSMSGSGSGIEKSLHRFAIRILR